MSGSEGFEVSLLDYGAGNVRSIRNAITTLGYNIKDVKSAKDIEDAQVLVFPGVGSFGCAMESLNGKGLTVPLRRYIEAGRPYFGICIGMQVLFLGSEESPGVAGLGIISETVQEFDRSAVSVPHIGWNSLTLHKQAQITAGLTSGKDTLYFVHSYRALSVPEEWLLATTTYGEPGNPSFVAAVQKGNVSACQFHPEKSGRIGLDVLGAFLAARGIESSSGERLPFVTSGGKTTLAKRIVACLDVRSNDDGDLVVTKGDQYDVRESSETAANGGSSGGGGSSSRKVRNLGKPVDLAKRYYDEGADEVCFLNITSFRQGVLEDQSMLKVLEEASKCVFVPLTVGGGIRAYTDAAGAAHSALEVAAGYFRAGADKVSLGSDAVYAAEELLAAGGVPTGNSSIEQISKVYGRQAVVVSIDPKRQYVAAPTDAPKHKVFEMAAGHTGPNGERYAWYQATVKGGREGRDIDAVALAKACEQLGAGEILLNSVDADGQKAGFDIPLVKAVMEAVSIPVVASSGAGAPEHFSDVFRETDVQAALAAGIFHRKEVAIADVKSHLEAQGILARRA